MCICRGPARSWGTKASRHSRAEGRAMPADHGKFGDHMKHGSESFYIEGEGLLVTQVGGRTGDEPDPMDSSETTRAPAPRALAAREPVPFRFSRVGPKGTPLNATITKK